MIKKGDIVIHVLSNLWFKCENQKMEKWMNMNKFYTLDCSSKEEHQADTLKVEISELSSPTKTYI